MLALKKQSYRAILLLSQFETYWLWENFLQILVSWLIGEFFGKYKIEKGHWN